MTVTDLVYSVLSREGPLISGDIQKILMSEYGLKRDASRKRIERSVKLNNVKKYIDVSNKGYVYYIPKLHKFEQIKNKSINYMNIYKSRLYSLVKILNDNDILSIEELCRLYNIKCNFRSVRDSDKKIRIVYDDKINTILIKLNKFGYVKYDRYMVKKMALDEVIKLVDQYEEKMKDEYLILTFAINYLINTGVQVEISNYRNNRETRFFSKFDALGKAGFKNIISLTIECQTRRNVTVFDLNGYQNRRGSSIRRGLIPKPIISYFISREFSAECIEYSRKNHIHLLQWLGRANFTDFKPDLDDSVEIRRGGRYSNLKGDALEFYVHIAYEKQGYKAQIKKIFYLNNEQEITEKECKHTYTDVDVYAVKDNVQVHLIECKRSNKQLSKKHLFTIIDKYTNIANYLKNKYGFINVMATIMCNFNELDAIEAVKLSNILLQIITPKQFYYQNRKLLKGVPKWIFFEEEIISI